MKLKRIAMCAVLLLTSTVLLAQQKVSGVVVDSHGEPVIGATVKEQGSTSGTVTDFDGNYSLTVKSAKAVLEFSYVGCKTQTIPVGGKSKIDVTLQEDSKLLDEVVVMAYTSTVKRKVVASVTNIDMSQVENLAGYKDMGNALQGRVAGVIITNNSSRS